MILGSNWLTYSGISCGHLVNLNNANYERSKDWTSHLAQMLRVFAVFLHWKSSCYRLCCWVTWLILCDPIHPCIYKLCLRKYHACNQQTSLSIQDLSSPRLFLPEAFLIMPEWANLFAFKFILPGPDSQKSRFLLCEQLACWFFAEVFPKAKAALALKV